MRRSVFWKWSFFLLGLPVLFIITVMALLFYHQDAVLKNVLDKVNTTFEGKMTIDDIHITPWKSFPYISVDLENVRFYESEDTTCLPLYSFKDIYAGFDVWDIVQNNYVIKSIKIEQGHLDIIHFEDGTYNILKAKNTFDEDSTESVVRIDIKKWDVRDVRISYYDQSTRRKTDLFIGHMHQRIRIQEDHFYIDMTADMQCDILENGAPTFFFDKKLHLDIELDYDKLRHYVHIWPSRISLDAARFKAEGTIDVLNDMDLSLKFIGEKPDFGLLSAFLPKEIGETLQSYPNEGQIYFNGSVQGKSIQGHVPLVSVDFGCKEGYFLNPSARKKLDELNFNGHFTNGESRSLESSRIEIRNLNARPDQGIFQGHVLIQNFKDPFVKVDMHADLDLDFLGKFFKIKDFEGVKGRVLLDMKFDELIDLQWDASSLAQLKKGIDSELFISDLAFKIPEWDWEVSDARVHAFMRNGKMVMDTLFLKINDSDLWLSGTLSDFPAVFHQYDKPVSLSLEARSGSLDLSHFRAFLPDSSFLADEKLKEFSMKGSFHTSAREIFHATYLPKGEFFIDELNVRLKHYPHFLHDFNADILISENDIAVKDFTGIIDDSDFHFSGLIRHYPKWFQPQPKGDSHYAFEMTAGLLKINDILTYKGTSYVPESWRNEVLKGVKCRGHADVHYDNGFQSVDIYLDEWTAKMNIHPLKMEKFSGRMHYENKHLTVDNFSGRMGKSDFRIGMSYFLGDNDSQPKKENYVQLTSSYLDLDALMDYKGPDISSDHKEAYNIFEQPFPRVRLTAEIGQLHYHRYTIGDFRTKLRLKEDHYIYVDTLSMKVADGALQMRGYFNGSDPTDIYYHSTMYAQNLDVEKLLWKFDNFGQDQLVHENLHGKISGTMTSTFKMHPDLTPIIEKSKARMDLMVMDGRLENFTPMLTMSRYFKDKNLNKIRFDTMTNVLELDDGALNIPGMVINSSLGHIQLSGRQKVDMSMEYFIKVPVKIATKAAWRHVFNARNTRQTDPDQWDDIEQYDPQKGVRYVHLRLEGTPDDFQVKMGRDKKRE
jgi:hypothetical protein